MILIVGALCVALFFGLRGAAWSMVDVRINDTRYIRHKTDKTASEFQTYVSDQNLSSSDAENISKWIRKHWDVTCVVDAEETVYYDMYGSVLRDSSSEISEIMDETNAYPITFADGSYRIYLYGFFGMSYYLYAEYALAVVCMVIFFLIIGGCVSHKIKYIKAINYGIGIMEGGALDYTVPVRGHDELTEVAISLNSMRRTLKEQIQAEEEARQANHKLITAVSHDLRTPLTAQIGYLEILKKCAEDLQPGDPIKRYLEKCMASSIRLKEMTDDMFEYFLVSASDSPDQSTELTEYDAPDIFAQSIGEGMAFLEEKGYHLQMDICEESGTVRLYINYLIRILDNIVSNLLKYADPQKPIQVRVDCDAGFYRIAVTNAVKRDRSMEESTGIGTKSIEILVKRMDGTVVFEEADGQYTVQISLARHA